VAYLVPQGQKEVIEEDGGGRKCIILVTIARSKSQNRCKAMPTCLAVLEIPESKNWMSPIMDEVGRRDLTNYYRCQ